MRVIQFAKFYGIKTVNIIRDAPNAIETHEFLKSLGADYVFTDTELSNPNIQSQIKQLQINTAFNCVGGKSSSDLLKLIEKKGSMITYGGMSGRPVQVSTGELIFRDKLVRGFWMTEWYKRKSIEERERMIEKVFEVRCLGGLCDLPSEILEWKRNKEIITDSSSEYNLNENDRFILEAVKNKCDGLTKPKLIIRVE